MKTRSLRRLVRQLGCEGKIDEAIALLETEMQATKTLTSPAGACTVPDFKRQLAALRIILGPPKKRG
jgi:hypothetical protein